MSSKTAYIRLPCWSRGSEPTCQCGGCRFNPWSGKTPHAVRQLSLYTTILNPSSRVWETQLPKLSRLEPGLCNK